MTTATIKCSPAGRTRDMAELFTAIGEGDPAAWDEIIHRYGGHFGSRRQTRSTRYSRLGCDWPKIYIG